MNELYVIFFRYDRGEEYSIYDIGTDRNQMKKLWKEDLLKFFEYGPDDVSQLWFIKLGDLSQDQFNQLTSSDEDISNKCLETILVNGKDWDQFGWDRNDCPYLKEELGCHYGTDMFELLMNLYDEDDFENLVNDDDQYRQEIKNHLDELD